MLFFIKQKIEHQLIIALASLALSSLAVYFSESSPSIRLNFDMCFRGIMSAIAIFLTFGLIYAALLYFRPETIRASLQKMQDTYCKMSVFALLGASLCAGTAEELLLRAQPFSMLSSYTFADFILWIFLLVHFCAMIGLYYCGKKHLIWTSLKAAECSCYALLYCHHRSFFLIAVTHGAVELTTSLVMRTEIIKHHIGNRLSKNLH